MRQREPSAGTYAVIGAGLLLPAILFASTGLWVGMAAAVIGAVYLLVMAAVTWRKSNGPQ